MSFLTPDRLYEEELLDAGVGTDDDVRKNLLDLRRLNSLLGGTATVLDAIKEMTRGWRGDRLALLDIGTGSADIPAEVAEWCGSRGINAEVVALDISERNLRIAHTQIGISKQVRLVRGDALRLPFLPGSFDFVTASQFLHHFRDEEVVELLAGFSRIARRAVIIGDLARNLIPYYAVRMLGPFMSSSLTRNDGPVSVLRGFTVPEMARLAKEAGLPRFRARAVFPFRVLLTSEKD